MAEADSTQMVPERYTVRHVLNMALAHKKTRRAVAMRVS